MKRHTPLFAVGKFAGLMMLAWLALELGSGQVSAAVPATLWLETPITASNPALSTMTNLTQPQAENAYLGTPLVTTQASEVIHRVQLVKTNQLLLAQPWSKLADPVATNVASSSASNDDVNDADEPNDIFSADDVNDDNDSDDNDDDDNDDPNDDVNDADEPNDIFSADDVNDDDDNDD
jgi:hypothetical protein